MSKNTVNVEKILNNVKELPRDVQSEILSKLDSERFVLLFKLNKIKLENIYLKYVVKKIIKKENLEPIAILELLDSLELENDISKYILIGDLLENICKRLLIPYNENQTVNILLKKAYNHFGIDREYTLIVAKHMANGNPIIYKTEFDRKFATNLKYAGKQSLSIDKIYKLDYFINNNNAQVDTQESLCVLNNGRSFMISAALELSYDSDGNYDIDGDVEISENLDGKQVYYPSCCFFYDPTKSLFYYYDAKGQIIISTYSVGQGLIQQYKIKILDFVPISMVVLDNVYYLLDNTGVLSICKYADTFLVETSRYNHINKILPYSAFKSVLCIDFFGKIKIIESYEKHKIINDYIYDIQFSYFCKSYADIGRPKKGYVKDAPIYTYLFSGLDGIYLEILNEQGNILTNKKIQLNDSLKMHTLYTTDSVYIGYDNILPIDDTYYNYNMQSKYTANVYQ